MIDVTLPPLMMSFGKITQARKVGHTWHIRAQFLHRSGHHHTIRIEADEMLFDKRPLPTAFIATAGRLTPSRPFFIAAEYAFVGAPLSALVTANAAALEGVIADYRTALDAALDDFADQAHRQHQRIERTQS